MAVIHAHSPQATGRVERLFKTFQDRLITELRLAESATVETANRFRVGSLPTYNLRFSVQHAQTADLHRPRPARRDFDRRLCLKTTRVVRPDWTGAHQGQLYQIRDHVRATHVMVEERVDGTMRMTHHGRPLTQQAIVARPLCVLTPPMIARPQRPVTPTRAHPWRTRLRPTQATHAAAALT